MRNLVSIFLFSLCLLSCTPQDRKANSRIVLRNSSIRSSEFFSNFLNNVAGFYRHDSLNLDSITDIFIHTGFIPGIDETEKLQVRQALELLMNCKDPLVEAAAIDIKIDESLLAYKLSLPSRADDTLSVYQEPGIKRIQVIKEGGSPETDSSLDLAGNTLLVEYVYAPGIPGATVINWTEYLLPCLDKFPRRVVNGLASFFSEYSYFFSRNGQMENFKRVPEGFILKVEDGNANFNSGK